MKKIYFFPQTKVVTVSGVDYLLETGPLVSSNQAKADVDVGAKSQTGDWQEVATDMPTYNLWDE